MHLGVVFPQTEIGADPAGVRDFAQAAEELGYEHLFAFDHVIGANPASRPGYNGLYTHQSMFHEPFVLFGYLAGETRTIGLSTGILILPQRQTVLVAKQAAEVDVLSGGRLRLGVGIGWNPVEYEALGENFHDRGRRSEEQIALLRALWTENPIDFEGDRHRIEDSGINPLPVQRPIPVWLGGVAEPVVKRVGRIADGWFPRFPSLGQRTAGTAMPKRDEEPGRIIERMRGYARAAGRDPDEIGIEGRVIFGDRSPDQWREEYRAWQAIGATHMQVFTMDCGLQGPDAHIDAMRRVKQELAGL